MMVGSTIASMMRDGIDQDGFLGGSDRTLWIEDIHRHTG